MYWDALNIEQQFSKILSKTFRISLVIYLEEEAGPHFAVHADRLQHNGAEIGIARQRRVGCRGCVAHGGVGGQALLLGSDDDRLQGVLRHVRKVPPASE